MVIEIGLLTMTIWMEPHTCIYLLACVSLKWNWKWMRQSWKSEKRTNVTSTLLSFHKHSGPYPRLAPVTARVNKPMNTFPSPSFLFRLVSLSLSLSLYLSLSLSLFKSCSLCVYVVSLIYFFFSRQDYQMLETSSFSKTFPADLVLWALHKRLSSGLMFIPLGHLLSVRYKTVRKFWRKGKEHSGDLGG